MKIVFFTPPIAPYGNDLHIGQCCTIILADVFSRYRFLLGDEVITSFYNNFCFLGPFLDRVKVSSSEELNSKEVISQLLINRSCIQKKISLLGVMKDKASFDDLGIKTKSFVQNFYLELFRRGLIKLKNKRIAIDFWEVARKVRVEDFGGLKVYPEKSRKNIFSHLEDFIRKKQLFGSSALWPIDGGGSMGIEIPNSCELIGKRETFYPNFYAPFYPFSKKNFIKHYVFCYICGRNITSQFILRPILVSNAVLGRAKPELIYAHGLLVDEHKTRFSRRNGNRFGLTDLLRVIEDKVMTPNFSDRIRYIIIASVTESDTFPLIVEARLKEANRLSLMIHRIATRLRSLEVFINFELSSLKLSLIRQLLPNEKSEVLLQDYCRLMDAFQFRQAMKLIAREIWAVYKEARWVRKGESVVLLNHFVALMVLLWPFLPSSAIYGINLLQGRNED